MTDFFFGRGAKEGGGITELGQMLSGTVSYILGPKSENVSLPISDLLGTYIISGAYISDCEEGGLMIFWPPFSNLVGVRLYNDHAIDYKIWHHRSIYIAIFVNGLQIHTFKSNKYRYLSLIGISATK